MSKPNRIPAGQSSSFSPWQLPAVEDGNVVGVERSDASARELAREDPHQVVYSSVTAGQLDKIAREAETEGRREGYAAGIAEGREAGHREGLEAGRAAARGELEQQAGRLQQTLAALLDPLQDQQRELEQALVALAGEMAKTLVQRELRGDSSAITAIVAEAVGALPVGAAETQVRLNPDDHALLLEHAGLPADWQLIADPAIASGGCRVQSAHSLVDFTLPARIAELVEKLLDEGGARS